MNDTVVTHNVRDGNGRFVDHFHAIDEFDRESIASQLVSQFKLHDIGDHDFARTGGVLQGLDQLLHVSGLQKRLDPPVLRLLQVPKVQT